MSKYRYRYALGIEYDGSRYYGWQSQRQQPTVQDCLERALSVVANQDIQINGAGRTDTGVHALCQVAHFDSDSDRSPRSWVLGSNSNLDEGTSVLWVRRVPEAFHARFSATARTYRYRILNRWVRPAISRSRMAWVRKPLDETVMNTAAGLLKGEHDFSAFRASGCQAKHGRREIQQISVVRKEQTLTIEVRANGFLYHMVRNIAGSLIRIGLGEKDRDWLQKVLESKDRKQAGFTAPPQGLYFVAPSYPGEFGIPEYPHIPFPAVWNDS